MITVTCSMSSITKGNKWCGGIGLGSMVWIFGT